LVFGSNTIVTLTDVATTSTYQQYSYTATATSTSTTLEFQEVQGNNPYYSLLDDISVGIQTGGGGDPHFTGFDGLAFDFMGKADVVFNLFSAQDLLINARFSSAQNPHHFNYSFEPTFMSEIGIHQGDSNWIIFSRSDDPKLSPFKEALPSNKQHNAIQTFYLDNNGVAVWQPPATLVVTFPHYIITMTRQYEPTQLSTDVYEVYMNMFMILTPQFSGNAHGVLGQTITPLADRLVGPENSLQGGGKIQGVWEDYIIHSGSLFGTDFVFNEFNKSADTTKLNTFVTAVVQDGIITDK